MDVIHRKDHHEVNYWEEGKGSNLRVLEFEIHINREVQSQMDPKLGKTTSPEGKWIIWRDIGRRPRCEGEVGKREWFHRQVGSKSGLSK